MHILKEIETYLNHTIVELRPDSASGFVNDLKHLNHTIVELRLSPYPAEYCFTM